MKENLRTSSVFKLVHYRIYPLFGKVNEPYSIVAFPSHKQAVVNNLIKRTRELSLILPCAVKTLRATS